MQPRFFDVTSNESAFLRKLSWQIRDLSPAAIETIELFLDHILALQWNGLLALAPDTQISNLSEFLIANLPYESLREIRLLSNINPSSISPQKVNSASTGERLILNLKKSPESATAAARILVDIDQHVRSVPPAAFNELEKGRRDGTVALTFAQRHIIGRHGRIKELHGMIKNLNDWTKSSRDLTSPSVFTAIEILTKYLGTNQKLSQLESTERAKLKGYEYFWEMFSFGRFTPETSLNVDQQDLQLTQQLLLRYWKSDPNNKLVFSAEDPEKLSETIAANRNGTQRRRANFPMDSFPNWTANYLLRIGDGDSIRKFKIVICIGRAPLQIGNVQCDRAGRVISMFELKARTVFSMKTFVRFFDNLKLAIIRGDEDGFNFSDEKVGFGAIR